MEQKNYITIEGYKQIKEELHDLVTKSRPILVNTITWAAGNGDRSENGDYIYGKKQLREIDKKIYLLTKKLETAEVIDPKVHMGSEKFFFGATVTILRNNSIEQVIKIVGQDEVNTALNHISWKSPLSRLLLNKTVGDSFLLHLPKGDDLIEILEVSYK